MCFRVPGWRFRRNERGRMKIKSWPMLLVAIVALAAFSISNKAWGRWIFAIVMFSVLALASERLLREV